jgi:hypothetical protein
MDDIANLEESVRKKTDEACALNEIITSSGAQIAHVTAKCSALTEERDEMAMKLEEVTLEKDELAKRLASKEEEVSNYSADVSKLEASIEALSRERDTAIAKMNEILSHNGVAEEALSCLKNEKDELAYTLEQMKADVSHLEAQEENSNVNFCKLNATIVDLQSRNAHLVKDIQTSKSELNEHLSRCGAIGTWAHKRHRATNHQPLPRDNVLTLSLSGVNGDTNAQLCRRNEDEDGITINDRRDDCPRSSAQSNNVTEVRSNAKGKSVVDVVYVVNGIEFPASEHKNKVKPSLSSVVAGAIVVEASEDLTRGPAALMRQLGRKRNNSEVGIVSKRRKRRKRTNAQEYGAGYKFKKFFVAHNRVRRLP